MYVSVPAAEWFDGAKCRVTIMELRVHARPGLNKCCGPASPPLLRLSAHRLIYMLHRNKGEFTGFATVSNLCLVTMLTLALAASHARTTHSSQTISRRPRHNPYEDQAVIAYLGSQATSNVRSSLAPDRCCRCPETEHMNRRWTHQFRPGSNAAEECGRRAVRHRVLTGSTL